YLKRAREDGIVYVEIRPPRREDVDLSRELVARYGLARVVVARGGPNTEDSLSAVAAQFVEGLLRTGLPLGISWGRTLAGVVRQLRPGTVTDLTIGQLSGGLHDPTPGIQGHELVRRIAELYSGSRVHYVLAPAIVSSEAAWKALLTDRTIQAALGAARRSEVALVGIGQMSKTATPLRGGHVRPQEWDRLAAAGAVGNMNTRFFDARGHPVLSVDRRTIALTWDELRAIPTVVAIAAGAEKVVAIKGALSTGCVDMLVTDEATARSL